MKKLGVEIVIAKLDEKTTLAHLLQLHMYDFTEYTDVPAQIFWTHVVSEISNGHYVEKNEKGRRYQTFKCEN